MNYIKITSHNIPFKASASATISAKKTCNVGTQIATMALTAQLVGRLFGLHPAVQSQTRTARACVGTQKLGLRNSTPAIHSALAKVKCIRMGASVTTAVLAMVQLAVNTRMQQHATTWAVWTRTATATAILVANPTVQPALSTRQNSRATRKARRRKQALARAGTARRAPVQRATSTRTE